MDKIIKVSHLVSYYETNHLYSTMIEQLSLHDVKQLVISPRGFNETKTPTDSVDYHGADLWNSLDKIWTTRKSKKYHEFLSNCPSSLESDLCHAHSLYSDGIVAYQRKLAFGIPYVITIRNTDLRIFAKYFFHLRSLIKNVLAEAAHVIFVNNHYEKRLSTLLNFQFDSAKTTVIPNGLDKYWFDATPVPLSKTPGVVNVLSVGNVIKLKNHKTLINAINHHNETRTDSLPEIRLTIVGNYNSRYGNYLRDKYNSERINFAGSLSFAQIELKMKENDVFALLSWRENFGIAYAEAVSQGLPIIYTKGEGFDGWVKEGVWGYACEFNDKEKFIRLALELAENTPLSSKAIDKLEDLFAWENVAKKIRAVYTKSLNLKA